VKHLSVELLQLLPQGSEIKFAFGLTVRWMTGSLRKGILNVTYRNMAKRFEVMRAVVHPWHHDHFGHMNVRHYATFFDDATYHLWTCIGLPYSRMLDEHGVHCVTAQATTHFVKELVAGDLIVIDGVVARIGTKSVAFELEMRHAETCALHATYEITEVFFDPGTRTSAAMPASVRKRLEGLVLRD